MEMTRPGKVQKADFPTALGKPAPGTGFPHFHRPTTGFNLGRKNKQKTLDARRPLHRCASLREGMELQSLLRNWPSFRTVPWAGADLPPVRSATSQSKAPGGKARCAITVRCREPRRHQKTDAPACQPPQGHKVRMRKGKSKHKMSDADGRSKRPGMAFSGQAWV